MSNLRKIRKDRGYTQVELSELSNVTQNTISRLETGAVKRTSYDTAYSLALILKCETEELGLSMHGEKFVFEEEEEAELKQEKKKEDVVRTMVLCEPLRMYKYLA